MRGAQKWLVLAILGLAPAVLFGAFFVQEGFDLAEMGDQLLGELLPAAIVVDVMISSLVFWVWMWPRARPEAGRSPWLFVAANMLVGLSFALPLFLYFRARNAA